MYAGSSPFSERESQALSRYLKQPEQKIIAYVSLHTFGQTWMTPYGHTGKKPADYKELVLFVLFLFQYH